MPKSDIVEGSVPCVVVRTSGFTPFCGAQKNIPVFPVSVTVNANFLRQQQHPGPPHHPR